jgi:soluble lytic murein transglycosylase-like protein
LYAIGVFKLANRYILEVESTGTQRTRDEIVSLLNDTKTKASEASKELSLLKTQSTLHAQSVSEQSAKVTQLTTLLSRESSALKDTKDNVSFLTKTIREEERELDNLAKKLNQVRESQAGLSVNGGAASRATALKSEQQQLTLAYAKTAEAVEQHKVALEGQKTIELEQVNRRKLLTNGIINEREVLNQSTQAHQQLNNAKQRINKTYVDAENNVRGLTRELASHDAQQQKVQKTTERSTIAMQALANAVGYAAYHAFRNFLEQGKDFIVQTAIYAARTDEMRLAMLNMAKQSGHSRGEILNQEAAIRRLNITTQEARETLTKFQLAQLDVTKAAQLARVAQDLAVVAGVETGEELNRLTHGITTLQIRVLRTAGVFVSLEGSMKAAAIAQGRSTESFSEAEKQQILLNKVLEIGARAAGNYETSLDNAGKRMRSMTRIFQDLQNSIGALVQGPFGALVDVLSGFMTLIGNFPKAAVVVTLVLAALGAQFIKNLFAVSGNTGAIAKYVQMVAMATKQTIGWTAANEQLAVSQGKTALTTTASGQAAGWGSVAKSMGGVILLAGQIAAAYITINTLLSITAELSKGFGGTTKYNDLIDSSDVASQKQGLSDLRKEYEALGKEIDKRKRSGYTDQYGRGTGVFGAFNRVLDDNPYASVAASGIRAALGQESAENMSKRYQKMADDIDQVNAKLVEHGEEVGLLAALQREYTEQLGKAGKVTLDFASTSQIVGFRVDRLRNQFNALSSPIDKESGYVLTLAERLNALKPEFLDLDTIMQKAATSQEDYLRMVAEAENTMPVFTDALRQLRSEGEKFIVGIGEREGEAVRRLIDVARRLESSRREIRGLLGDAASPQEKQAGALELEEKRLQIVRQEIDSINTARIALNRDVGAPIPSNREQRVSLQATYETAIKVRDEIRAAQRANRDFVAEVVKGQQLAAEANKNSISTELTAAKLIADNQVKRVSDERQMTAEIIALSKEREAQALDEAGSQRRAFGTFYKEQLENLIASEDSIRRRNTEISFAASGTTIAGIDIPNYAGVSTALENIAIPTATQAENVATIATSVKNIETAVLNPKNYAGTALGDLMGATYADPKYGPRNAPPPSMQRYFEDASKKFGVPLGFLTAIGQQESSFNPRVTSPKGAAGVMQLMPGTATRFNVTDRYDPQQSIMGGAAYLKFLLNRFNGNPALAAAAYNAGEGAVDKYKGVPPYAETRNYVQKVMANLGLGDASVTSPAFSGFKQTGATTVTPLTPQQIVSATRYNAMVSERQNRFSREGYVTADGQRSPLADVRLANLRTQTADEETENYRKTADELGLINDRIVKDYYDSEDYKKQITQEAELARRRSVIQTHATLIGLLDEEKIEWRTSSEYITQVSEDAEIRLRNAYNSSFDTLEALRADSRKRAEFNEKYLETIRNNGEAARLRTSQQAEDKYNDMLEESNSKWRGSTKFKLAQWQEFETDRYNATKRAEDAIAELQYSIAHAGETDPLKIETARLKAILEIKEADGEAKASMAANSVKLADAQIYHAARADAKVMEYLASQRSVDDVVADARIGLVDSLFGAMDAGLSKVTSKMGIFGDLIKDVVLGFTRIAANKFFLSLFGLDGTAGGNGGGGAMGGMSFASILPAIVRGGLGGNSSNSAASNPAQVLSALGVNFSSGSASGGLSGLFSYGSALPGVAPIGFPASASQNTSPWGSLFHLINPSTTATATGAAAGIGGIAAALGPLAPFLGAGLGAQLGGSSKLGMLAGGAGGLLAGGIAATFLAPGLFSTGGLLGPALLPWLTNPVTAIVAAGLIATAVILKKNKEKRQNEKLRDGYMSDSLGQLNSLLSQVRRDKIGGAEALAQASSIREQYMSNAQALSDKKTRAIALKDVSRLDAVIGQIKAATKAQERRQELDNQLVPEFAGGGRVVSSGRGGVVGGLDLGYDNVSALLRPREVVLNLAQQKALGGPSALAAAGVPGFVKTTAMRARQYANGGYSSPFVALPENRNYGNSSKEMNIFMVTDKKFAEKLAIQGRDKIIDLAAASVKDKDKLYAEIRNI